MTRPPDAGQHWDPGTYDRNARFVSDLGAPVLALLAPRAGEAILDLGCGDGRLTRGLEQAGASVLGTDASPDMVAAARALGLEVELHDARALPFHDRFDAVFSNAVLHWIHELDQVVAGVVRALKPGGRFVGEMGGHGNVAAICTALRAVLGARGHPCPSPYRFPTPEAFSTILSDQGLTPETVQLIPRPTPLPTDMSGWLNTFGRPFVRDLPAPEQEAVLAEAVDLLRPALCDDAGRWTADYVRLRFKATKR